MKMIYYTVCPDCGYKLLKAGDGSTIEIHCPKCGIVPVPEKDLPVKLPYDVEFRPTGKSPLASHEGFMNCRCPECGGKATRDR